MGTASFKQGIDPKFIPRVVEEHPTIPVATTQVTLAAIRPIAKRIINGARCIMYDAPCVAESHGGKLEYVAWGSGRTINDGLATLFDATRIVTTIPRTSILKPGEVAVSLERNGSVSFYKMPESTEEMKAMAWINAGKPCGYRYGFSWKGASTRQISSDSARARLSQKKYFELSYERRGASTITSQGEEWLVFVEYSENDLL